MGELEYFEIGIDRTTKSTDVMDVFEGEGEDSTDCYEKLIIHDLYFVSTYNGFELMHGPCQGCSTVIHLIVERAHIWDGSDVITFTQLKNKRDDSLKKHLEKEVEKNIPDFSDLYVKRKLQELNKFIPKNLDDCYLDASYYELTRYERKMFKQQRYRMYPIDTYIKIEFEKPFEFKAQTNSCRWGFDGYMRYGDSYTYNITGCFVGPSRYYI